MTTTNFNEQGVVPSSRGEYFRLTGNFDGDGTARCCREGAGGGRLVGSDPTVSTQNDSPEVTREWRRV